MCLPIKVSLNLRLMYLILSLCQSRSTLGNIPENMMAADGYKSFNNSPRAENFSKITLMSSFGVPALLWTLFVPTWTNTKWKLPFPIWFWNAHFIVSIPPPEKNLTSTHSDGQTLLHSLPMSLPWESLTMRSRFCNQGEKSKSTGFLSCLLW